MRAKHAPGPWSLHTFGDGSMAILPAEGFTVTVVKPRAGFESDIPNFKLMAAAPEMFAALEELTLWNDRATDDDAAEWIARVITQARAALAKAKGGAK